MVRVFEPHCESSGGGGGGGGGGGFPPGLIQFGMYNHIRWLQA